MAPQIEPVGHHDACFLPRSSHVTGDIGIHELAWAGDELWMVSTRFSCLCTLDPTIASSPVGDRRSLRRWPRRTVAISTAWRSSMATQGNVTALGTTDVRDGWRVDKPHGGCIIDINSGEFVTRRLCMPHSPRWHGDKRDTHAQIAEALLRFGRGR